MKKLILLISVVALLAAGCGAGDTGDAGAVTTEPGNTTTTAAATTTSGVPGDNTGTTTTTTTLAAPDVQPADQVFVDLYFVKEGLSAATVTRAVDSPQVATNAVKALIAGPTPAEMDTELSSSIPSDTLLLGLTIDNGLATVDLSREFEVGGGSFNILSRLAQVVYTLTQFPTVDKVLFYIDGKPVDVFSGEGVVLDSPVTRADYLSLLPLEPAVDAGPAPLWHQGDMPDVSGVAAADLGKVVLVAADDALNVREDPGVSAPVVGMMAPGVIVEKTGLDQVVGSSVWEQIATPLGDYWVNGRFLGAVVTATDFANNDRVVALLDEFAGIIAGNGDLRQVTSQRGLYVSHNADPIRFSPDQLSGILTDSTTYKWPSNALGPDQLDELPAKTFAEAITDSFLSAYDDPDTQLSWNDPITGGNGRIPGAAIPFEFAGFNYVGVYDPGDDPQYEGLDWTTWYVSIDYENGDPVIVGLTVDMWAP